MKDYEKKNFIFNFEKLKKKKRKSRIQWNIRRYVIKWFDKIVKDFGRIKNCVSKIINFSIICLQNNNKIFLKHSKK